MTVYFKNDRQPEIAVWPPKPKVHICLKVWQTSSKFQRQTWVSRPRRARRECPWAIPIMTDNFDKWKWPPKLEILKLWPTVLKFPRQIWVLRPCRARKKYRQVIATATDNRNYSYIVAKTGYNYISGFWNYDMASKFYRQIWGFQPWRARQCYQVIATTTDSSSSKIGAQTRRDMFFKLAVSKTAGLPLEFWWYLSRFRRYKYFRFAANFGRNDISNAKLMFNVKQNSWKLVNVTVGPSAK